MCQRRRLAGGALSAATPGRAPRDRGRTGPSARALGAGERQAVLDVLHSDRFVDQAPAEVHATLLEEQTYLCSTRTMYRILADAGEVRERRDQARHPAYAKPELVATAPNQIWSWDITKLKGPVAYLYFSLYVILDLFSRYVVGWMVAAHENARLAQRLIEATCAKQGIGPNQLTIHADRGAPMRSKLVAELFTDLGDRRQPLAPAREQRQSVFGSPIPDVQIPAGVSGSIRVDPRCAGHLPRAVRAGTTTRIITAACGIYAGRRALRPGGDDARRRHRTRLAAYAAHPERFVQGPPRPETLPTRFGSTRRQKRLAQDAPGTTIVMPDDPQHGVSSGHTASRPIDRSCSSTAWRRFSKCGIRLSQNR